jgi:hypothetical protein
MTLLEDALDAHRHGWHVFPCQPRTKDQPATPHGCADAARDVEQIKRWWSKNPNYNPAVTGGVIVDCDTGLTSLQDVLTFAKLNGLPETLIVRTGRRSSYGAQLHFTGQAPNGRYETNGVAGEIRCHHQYGMAPGAIHPDTGERYEIVVNLPFAPWPANCALNVKRLKVSSAFTKNTKVKVRHPGRHDYLVDRATAFFHQGLFGPNLLQAVNFINGTYCDPPKPMLKVEGICSWVEENITPDMNREDENIVASLATTDPTWKAAWEGQLELFGNDAEKALRYLSEQLARKRTPWWKIEKILTLSGLNRSLQEDCPTFIPDGHEGLE